MKRILSLILAAAMLLAFGGCAEEETLAGKQLDLALAELVNGRLFERYMVYDSEAYRELSGFTSEEIAQRYGDALDADVRRFASYFRIEYPTDEHKAEIAGIFEELYRELLYSGGIAEKVDRDTYAVPVTVTPLRFFDLMVGEIRSGALDDFTSKFPSAVVGAMDDIAYRQYDAMWAREVLDLAQSELALLLEARDTGSDAVYNGDPQTFTVHVDKIDGKWTINEEELALAFEALIYYP